MNRARGINEITRRNAGKYDKRASKCVKRAIFKSLVPEIELLETGGTADGNFEIRGSDIFLVQKYPRRIEIVSIIVVK